jgi:hypothetical protein
MTTEGRYQELMNQTELSDDEEDEMLDLATCLLEENGLENPMNRAIAEDIIEREQGIDAECFGGYRLWRERSFEINGEEYTIIAYGSSNDDSRDHGISGMIFVKEDEESRKLRAWGENETARKFTRFMKYLNEVEKGLREPDGKDEFGDVPYICEKCKRRQGTISAGRGYFCNECFIPTPLDQAKQEMRKHD